MDCTMNELLKQLRQPAFTVKNRKILQVNEEAAHLQLEPGADLGLFWAADPDNYLDFDSGVLYLMIELKHRITAATVTRYPQCDLFVLDEDTPSCLRTLALAAKELRGPFSEINFLAERMKREDTSQMQQLENIYARNAFQIHRMVTNMADAAKLRPGMSLDLAPLNLQAFYKELFEKTNANLNGSRTDIVFHGLDEPLVTMADRKYLSRAVYNLLSNALKFTPKDGTIEAWLTHNRAQAILTIQDSGEGISDHVWGNLFTRFQRSPGVEDPRHGLGLGLLISSNIAAMHDGALLIQKAPGGGTRVSLTVSLHKLPNSKLYNHPLIVDDLGGQDCALVELSDVLPPEAYMQA